MPRSSRLLLFSICLSATLTACAPSRSVIEPEPPPETLVLADPALVGMRGLLGAQLDSIMYRALADSAAPGAALAVGRRGRLVHLKGYGRTDWREDAPAVTERTIYDLASLTKVVGTTTAAMILEEEGRLDLHRPVAEYLPGFDDSTKASITPYMLLTHTSGMTTRMLYREAKGREEYLEIINAYPLQAPPGTSTEYSDWNMIVMQLTIEHITGKPLDRFLQERVFGPLGMTDTGFLPDAALLPRVAPTEIQEWRGGKVHGVVHDENAWALGGVAGHAGLFSSARDLAVFAQMMLNGGIYNGVRILRPETIARWTARQDRDASRALGWDTPSEGSSAGHYFSAWSFGHTGFTGTSIWMDPHTNLFVVLLTNRVNPTRNNARVGPLRRVVADVVQLAVRDLRHYPAP